MSDLFRSLLAVWAGLSERREGGQKTRKVADITQKINVQALTGSGGGDRKERMNSRGI